MTTENKEFINCILEQWNQCNCPELYKPYREGDYVFIYGDCCGIVIYPSSLKDDDWLGYSFFEEDDGYYWIGDLRQHKNVGWIPDDLKCLQIALEYLKENGSPEYYSGCEENPLNQCSWKLPWKN